MRGGDTFEITSFADGVSFFAAERVLYDIVYIGCVMSKMDGMRVAKKIREYDRETALVLAAENIDYAVGGYEVCAADFLKKPIAFAAFSRGLDRIIGSLRKNEKTLNINYLVYHTFADDIRERGVLGEKKDELAGYGFSRINSGCLVNLMCVKRVDGDFVTVGGKILPISRSCKGEFYDEFERYMKNQIRL